MREEALGCKVHTPVLGPCLSPFPPSVPGVALGDLGGPGRGQVHAHSGDYASALERP